MGLFVLGVNHKECPVEVREKLHFSPTTLQKTLREAQQRMEFNELLILSTCNRVEFYGHSDDAQLPEDALLQLIENSHAVLQAEFRDYLYRYEGKEAARHLFRVAAGLDSLVIGENEILGQVREAFQQANQAQSVHSLVYRLVEKALKVGKDVRAQTKINEGAVSIPSAACELAEKIFGRLNGEKVLVLGTGEMSLLTLKNLRDRGADIAYLVSRNQERGQVLAEEFHAKWVSMDHWYRDLERVDILIASTSAPHPIVQFEKIKEVMQARRNRPLFLIDIAVPRDIEATINNLDDVYLYNVDDLKAIASSNLRQRRQDIHAAEAFVDRAVVDYQGWIERLKARPTLERFESFLDEILENEITRVAKSTNVSDEQKREMRHRIRQKLLHPPQARIKEASQNGGVTRYLEALHSLFGLEKEDRE